MDLYQLRHETKKMELLSAICHSFMKWSCTPVINECFDNNPMHNFPITTPFRALHLSQSPQDADRRTQEAIDQAWFALNRGETDVAVRDLQATLGDDKRAFHEAILNLLNSSYSQDGTRQAFIEQIHSQQPDFDFNAPDKNEKTVLDLAVQQKNRGLALSLLSKGATAISAENQLLLTRWRRQDLLYAHFNGNKQRWTNLDHALYEGNYDRAQKLLTEKSGGGDLNRFWEASLLVGWYDALRAILILSTPEELRELTRQQPLVGWWKQELHDDPGLVAVLKEFPYQSKVPENFNGKARFANSTRYIVCRHLAAYQQEQQARDPSGGIKFDYSQFQSPQHITEHVKLEFKKTSDILKAQAVETHLIDNTKFGQFLANQFAAMEKENKSTRLMLIGSTNHLMNLGLRIKEKNGKKSYVVKFFNPSQTTQGTRSKTSSLQTLEMQTIEDYVSYKSMMRSHYPETKGVSMIFIRPEQNTQSGTSTFPTPPVGKTLTSPIDSKDIDDTVVWHLMRYGFDGNLKQLHEHFQSLSDDQRIALLSGKYNDDTPALYMSMQNGHAEAVREYGKLLASIENIPKKDLIDLIAGKRKDGFPAIAMAMLQEHTEAVKEYKELWKLIPPDQRAELLLAKISEGKNKGYSVFYFALEERQFRVAHDLLQTLAQLAPELSPEARLFLRNELTDYERFILKIEHKHRQNPSSLPPYWKIQNELANLKKALDESGQPSASSMQN